MADYNLTPIKVIDNIKGLPSETLEAIKKLISVDDTPVKIVTSIDNNTDLNVADKIVVTVGEGFTGDLNKAGGIVDVIDASSSPTAIDLDYSAVDPNAATAPTADNVVIGSAFNDKVTTNNSKQVIEGLKGNDSITTGTGTDSISGGAGNDSLSSGAGNDSISSGSGQDSVDGGLGFDILTVDGAPSKTAFDGKILTLTGTNGNTVTVENVEYISFGNNTDNQFTVANQNQGTVLRIYNVLGRKADLDGSKFWTDAADTAGANATVWAAEAFINSEEGKEKSLDSMSNSDFVTKMFTDFVGRSGAQGGIDFWNKLLDDGSATKAQLMAGFASETEATVVSQDFIHIIGVSDVG